MLRARPAGALRQLAAANTSRHAPSSQRNFGASVAPVETVAEPSFFRGVWPIMATPFKKRADEPIDFTGFVKAVRFMAGAGADGVTITGVLGESNRLTDQERHLLIEAAVGVSQEFALDDAVVLARDDYTPRTVAATARMDRPFRVCVGTSHAGTAATVALSQMAHELGAHGVMVTPTKEASPQSDDSLVRLYEAVAAGCPGLPIVLQDHPASTKVPAVSCIKLESLPSPAKISALRALWRGHPPECTILTGLGALYAGFDLEQRTDGFMTGFAFPEILIAMNAAAQDGDYERAHLIYNRFLPLIVFEQQPGVGVRKEIYKLRGLISSAHVRHPENDTPPILVAALKKQIGRSLPGIDLTAPLPMGMFA